MTPRVGLANDRTRLIGDLRAQCECRQAHLDFFRKSQQGSPYYGHAQPENEGMAEVADGN